MPRKVDEKWGEEWFGDIELVGFENDQLDHWLDMLGSDRSGEDRERLRFWLTEIEISVRCGYKRGPRTLTRRQGIKALETFVAAETIDRQLIDDLNARAEDALFNQLFIMDLPEVGPGDSVVAAMSTNRVTETSLREAARRAIIFLKIPPRGRNGEPGKRIGRPVEATMPWAVEELCKLWERWTDTPVTSWNSDTAGYLTNATSKSGLWVTEVIRGLIPDASKSRVRLAIQDFVKNRGST